MKSRRFTRTAGQALTEVSAFIAADNPRRALEYIDAAEHALQSFDERFLPRRATGLDNVYVVNVPTFSGYSLWVTVTDKAIVVIGVFRPGLTTKMQLQRVTPDLTELSDRETD